MHNIDLAVKAGRKRQSLQTGFIHHCYEDPESRETIPLLENFCFALALFRTHTVDNMLEAKALIDKLMAFQVGDNFPVYLHEYPICRDLRLGAKIYPALHWNQIIKEKPDLPRPRVPLNPKTPEEWAELFLVSQLEGTLLPDLPYTSFAFRGLQRQEKFEPALTLFDLYAGELYGMFSKRAQQDHPVHLKAALIQPIEEKRPLPEDSHPFFWGDVNHTHSLVLETKAKLEDDVFVLPGTHTPDEMEIAFYSDALNQVTINGKKATTFQLGDEITIGEKFILKFEGEGTFFGHVFPSNRPGQIAATRFDAYDWKIALRTVRRPVEAKVRVTILEKGCQQQLPLHAFHCRHIESPL